MVTLTKCCTRCKQEKPLDTANFPPHNRTKSGFAGVGYLPEEEWRR